MSTYCKATAFLVPAIFFWWFALVYLFPKLQQLWVRGGGAGSGTQWLMEAVTFFMRRGGWIFGLAVLGLVVWETVVRSGTRHRQAAVGSVVFLLNALVMAGLTALCVAALLIAPP